MFAEDDLLPLSALQHFLFCDRQAALIHVDGAWADNALTVEGHDLHRTVDAMGQENRSGVMVRRGLSIRSWRLGLSGKADVVEFRPAFREHDGCSVPGHEGRWDVVPIEYKRGKPKAHRADEVQLCAQAMCLEEILGGRVVSGELFYGRTRRRHPVPFDSDLRLLTEESAKALHAMIRSEAVPVRAYAAKCRQCSLLSICLPPRRSGPRSASAYLAAALQDGVGRGLP